MNPEPNRKPNILLIVSDQERQRLPDIETMRDEHEFVVFETDPGDCSVHHGLTIHSA